MLYIMMCLILRTAYQGKQFEFIGKEMRRPDPKTIDELIQKQFTLLNLQDVKLFKNMEFMKK
jgi:ribosomal 50S subunit-associated protein YjgA (DUF615 family)